MPRFRKKPVEVEARHPLAGVAMVRQWIETLVEEWADRSCGAKVTSRGFRGDTNRGRYVFCVETADNRYYIGVRDNGSGPLSSLGCGVVEGWYDLFDGDLSEDTWVKIRAEMEDHETLLPVPDQGGAHA